jgi:hypothetical protein
MREMTVEEIAVVINALKHAQNQVQRISDHVYADPSRMKPTGSDQILNAKAAIGHAIKMLQRYEKLPEV